MISQIAKTILYKLRNEVFTVSEIRLNTECSLTSSEGISVPSLYVRVYRTLPHHGRAELDADGFIRAEENDKRTHIKKIRRKFYFFVKIRHIIYAIQNRLSCEPAFAYVYIQCEYRDELHLLILWKA